MRPGYMFDTNKGIYLMKMQPAQVADWFVPSRVGEVVTSAIAFAELSDEASVSVGPKREA